jgi:hypothetical protein
MLFADGHYYAGMVGLAPGSGWEGVSVFFDDGSHARLSAWELERPAPAPGARRKDAPAAYAEVPS